MALSGGARPKACPSFDQQEQRRCQHTTHRDDVRDDAKSKPTFLHEAKLPCIAAPSLNQRHNRMQTERRVYWT